MRDNAQTKTIKGFTLLELMLVLALATALALAGIAAYQIQLRNFKIDKTALQMQQWLQAGLAFRVDCNLWPSGDGAVSYLMGTAAIPDTCSNSNYVGKQRAYMPTGTDTGPWNNAYTLGLSDPTSPVNSPMFVVQTVIGPTSAIDHSASAAAQTIAGRLPNGWAWDENGQAWVKASIGLPPYSSGNNPPPPSGGGYIVDMEMVKARQTAQHIKKPTCPPGMTPALVSAISGVDGGYLNVSGGPLTGVSKALSNQKIDPATGFISDIPINGTTGKVQPDLTIFADQAGNVLQGNFNQVLLISACIPTSTIDGGSKNKNRNKGISSSFRY